MIGNEGLRLWLGRGFPRRCRTAKEATKEILHKAGSFCGDRAPQPGYTRALERGAPRSRFVNMVLPTKGKCPELSTATYHRSIVANQATAPCQVTVYQSQRSFARALQPTGNNSQDQNGTSSSVSSASAALSSTPAGTEICAGASSVAGASKARRAARMCAHGPRVSVFMRKKAHWQRP